MSNFGKDGMAVGRRGFLRTCALLGLGALGFGFREVVTLPSSATVPEFVIISGWVLPAQYFR